MRILCFWKVCFRTYKIFTISEWTWLRSVHSHRIVFHVSRGWLLPSRAGEYLCILSSKIHEMVSYGYDFHWSRQSKVNTHWYGRVFQSGVAHVSSTYNINKTNYYLYYMTLAHQVIYV